MCIDNDLEQWKEEDLVKYLEKPCMRNYSSLVLEEKYREKLNKKCIESIEFVYNANYWGLMEGIG
jgi:hypothetical protein